MPQYKLSYFDTRAFGEPIRLILHYLEIPFEDFRFTHAEWPTIKPTTPTGKVPVLEFDGKHLVESVAIGRYLARKHGLAGKDDLEQAKVDSFIDQNKDFFYEVIVWYAKKMGFRPNENEEELLKTKVIPACEYYLPLYERYLKESGSGFISKSGLTFADFYISDLLVTINKFGPELMKDHPDLLAYINRMKNLPTLKEYYATRKDNLKIPELKNYHVTRKKD